MIWKRFTKHFVAHRDAVPAAPDDVFVEALTGSDTEEEPALREDAHRCGRLGNNRWVVAHCWAGDPGAESDPLSASGNHSQHRPRESRMSGEG